MQNTAMFESLRGPMKEAIGSAFDTMALRLGGSADAATAARDDSGPGEYLRCQVPQGSGSVEVYRFPLPSAAPLPAKHDDGIWRR